jgi:hypothetical protein
VSFGQRGGSPTVVNLSFLDRHNEQTQHKIKGKLQEPQSITSQKLAFFFSVVLQNLMARSRLIQDFSEDISLY